MKTEKLSDTITIISADCRDVLPIECDVIVTDPPYGIDYKSGMTGHDGGVALPGIIGDGDTEARDAVLKLLPGIPAIVFGTWKREKPFGVKVVLTWEKGDHVGMGDLSIPWKPNTEEIYILGGGFSGHRGSSVLRHNAPVSWNSVAFGRTHPNEKPVSLMVALIAKCPAGTILDPFMGSGTTGIACIRSGRRFIGIEIDEQHYQTARSRLIDELAQTNLFRQNEDARAENQGCRPNFVQQAQAKI